LDRRLGEPQRRSGCCGGEKNLSLPGIKHRPLDHSLVAILTELSRLLRKAMNVENLFYKQNMLF
jgi:hypothetical protein